MDRRYPPVETASTLSVLGEHTLTCRYTLEALKQHFEKLPFFLPLRCLEANTSLLFCIPRRREI